MKEEKIVCFEVPGKQNTDAALKLAKERADKLKIKERDRCFNQWLQG